MKVTEEAAKQVLEVMDIMGMDPHEYSLLFSESDHGHCAIGFTREGEPEVFHGLGVVCSIDMSGIIVDLIEIEGKQGLTFINES